MMRVKPLINNDDNDDDDNWKIEDQKKTNWLTMVKDLLTTNISVKDELDKQAKYMS